MTANSKPAKNLTNGKAWGGSAGGALAAVLVSLLAPELVGDAEAAEARETLTMIWQGLLAGAGGALLGFVTTWLKPTQQKKLSLAALLLLLPLLGACAQVRADAETVAGQAGRAVTSHNDNRYNARQGCVEANNALARELDSQALRLAMDSQEEPAKRAQALEVHNLANAIRRQNHGALVSARALKAAINGETEGPLAEPFPPKACAAIAMPPSDAAAAPLAARR